MESIRDVLSKMTIPRASREASTAISSSDVCPTCGGAGWLRLEVDADDPRFGKPVPCACKAREIEEKRHRALLERSNLRTLSDKTFVTFRPNEGQQKALEYALAFADQPEGWLVLLGSYGRGKTHLAAAIGNRRIELGQPAVFMVAPDLLDHLRATFSPASETPFDDLFEEIKNTPLLILDDLGTQTTTSWAAEKLFQLLNHRYMSRLPTVITTNAPLDELGDRLASRMGDIEMSTRVELAGPDMRTGTTMTPVRGNPPPPARTRSSQRR